MARISDLSGEDLQKVLDVLGKADSVELKLTLLESRRASVAQALGIDALDAQIRQVFFFDTPKLDLNSAGVVVRARRRQNDTGDTVVKIRPVDPAELSDELQPSPSSGSRSTPCRAATCARLRTRVGGQRQDPKVVLGDGKTRKLFSKRQRASSASMPRGLELDDLEILGPIPTFRVKFKSDGYKRPMVGELWLYPDGSQVIELSTKTTPRSISNRPGMASVPGVERHRCIGEQQTKTKTALQFFSKGD